MVLSNAPLRGIIRGKAIELLQATGLPDGQEVTVTLQPTSTTTELAPGEGLAQSFGAWAEHAEELDKYLEWNRHCTFVVRIPSDPESKHCISSRTAKICHGLARRRLVFRT
jgi:hypothetical protein